MPVVVDLAEQNGKPPANLEQERGSAAGSRLYLSYDGFEADIPTAPTAGDIDKMLDRDGKVRSLEQVLTLPLRWANWSVEPHADDDGEAKLVREALFNAANAGGMTTPFELVVAQMASAVLYRRAYFEKVFVRQGDRLVYKKLAFRPPASCVLRRDKKDQGFDGFSQRFIRDGESVKEDFLPDKAFVYLHAQHRDPLLGASDFDTCWRIFDAKQKVRFLWLSFLENQTIPKAVVTDDSSDGQNVQALATKFATLKSGGVIGLKQGQKAEPFESSGQGAAEFRAAMDWLSAEQSQSVMASFTDLAQQGSGKGSFALSRDQSDLFLRSRQAVLNEMGACLTSWAAADLVRWNMGPAGNAPRLVPEDLGEHHSEAVMELFGTIMGQPAPNPLIPREFLDMVIEKAAHVLELDVDRVRKAIVDRDAKTPVQQMVSGVDSAAALVAQAGIGVAQ